MSRFTVCSATALLGRSMLWSLLAAGSAAGQSTVAFAGFTPGARQLVALDIANTALGELPAGIKQLNGAMEVVVKNGVRMLRASAPTDFLVELPEVLPQDFTIEFDFIAKACCNPEDVSFEGTPSKNRGANSAHVVWHRDILSVVGGGPMYQAPVSEETKKSIKGTLITAAYSMEGETLKLYTNGRRLYTLNDRKFVRARTLRVFLGGQDEDKHAVYLARLRIATGGPSASIALNPPTSAPAVNSGPVSQPNAPLTPGISAPPTSSSSSGLNAAPTPTIVTNVTVTDTPNGPVVSWMGGAAPAIYTVQRWKADDPACCSTTSPASPPLTGPPWQDTPPPLSGTYVYRVTATTNAGSANDEAQFQYLRTGGGTVVGAAGASSSGPRTLSTGTTTPTVTAPVAANAGPTPTTFAITVTMGSAGPMVSWPAVPQAAGYGASRSKIDDLNCCNTSSGRSLISASSWQDQPLPATGTYIYTVIATTPLGPIKAERQFDYTQPGGATTVAPVGVLPAAPTTGTINPQPASAPTSPGPAPAGVTSGTRPSVLSNGPAPTNLTVSGSPIAAFLLWTDVAGADRYQVNRAVAGTTTWTSLGSLPATSGPAFGDHAIPDHRQSYTYQVAAYQPDGSYGTATVDFTPPTPADPSGFTAKQTAPGEVKLEWNLVPGDSKWYFIAGPGTGTGISVIESPEMQIGPSPTPRNSYALTGIPAGTHTWTIATNWDPGGALTPSTAWPKATATVTGDPVPRYRLVVLGFKAEAQSKDINDARDGHGDEVYFSAIVNQTLFSGLPLPATKAPNLSIVRTKTFGDEAVSVPYGRIKAGTASATGGLRSSDLVPPGLDLLAASGATQPNNFPLLLWEGTLEGDAAVVIHPTLWEDDVDPIVNALWTKAVIDEAKLGYRLSANAVVRGRTNPGHGWQDDFFSELGGKLFECSTADVVLARRACEAHGVDRPIGLRSERDEYGQFGIWEDRVVVLTRATFDVTLTEHLSRPSPTMYPGTFAVSLRDLSDSGAIANYTLYLRVERLP